MNQDPHPAPGELYPGHADDAARQARRSTAVEAAQREPLPGPLRDAFASITTEIAGLRVRPVTHYDYAIMTMIDSPILRQLSSKEPVPWTSEQGYEMVLQFTRPPREAANLAAKGREAFRQMAIEQIGMALGPVEVVLLVRAVEREWLRVYATAQKYNLAGGDGPEGAMVFTPPPADPKTGSAGGSTTSAG